MYVRIVFLKSRVRIHKMSDENLTRQARAHDDDDDDDDDDDGWLMWHAPGVVVVRVRYKEHMFSQPEFSEHEKCRLAASPRSACVGVFLPSPNEAAMKIK